MSASRFFCSAASRANGEAIFGTVARIESWLLIEYPAAWPRAIEDTGLVVEGPDRQLLIRQSHFRSADRIRCFYAESREVGSRLASFDIKTYDDLATIDMTAGAPQPGTAERLFLACTHGKHDKCCARHGRPLYAALHTHFGDQAWQCSHVGGDRFAGNLVFLPEGIYYGRVDPAEAPALAESFTRGELSLGHYRGRSCYSRPAQVGEYFLRHETGVLRIDTFRLLEVRQYEPLHWRTRFGAASDVYTVEFAAVEDLRERLSCRSDEESPVRQYRLLSVTRRPEAPSPNPE